MSNDEDAGQLQIDEDSSVSPPALEENKTQKESTPVPAAATKAASKTAGSDKSSLSAEDTDFDWEAYLKEQGPDARLAPPECFFQSPDIPVNRFVVGQKVRVPDPRVGTDISCLGTIEAIHSVWVYVHLDGTDSTNKQWLVCDDLHLKPITEPRRELNPPVGFLPSNFHRFIDGQLIPKEDDASVVAPLEIFHPISVTLRPSKNLFEPGHRCEAIDHRSFGGKPCPATIVAVDKGRDGRGTVTVQFDGWGAGYNLRLPYDTRHLFPAGWAAKAGVGLQRPRVTKKRTALAAGAESATGSGGGATSSSSGNFSGSAPGSAASVSSSTARRSRGRPPRHFEDSTSTSSEKKQETTPKEATNPPQAKRVKKEERSPPEQQSQPQHSSAQKSDHHHGRSSSGQEHRQTATSGSSTQIHAAGSATTTTIHAAASTTISATPPAAIHQAPTGTQISAAPAQQAATSGGSSAPRLRPIATTRPISSVASSTPSSTGSTRLAAASSSSTTTDSAVSAASSSSLSATVPAAPQAQATTGAAAAVGLLNDPPQDLLLVCDKRIAFEDRALVVHVNHTCRVGPLLDRAKLLRNLPEQVGPAAVHHMLREVIQQLVNSAKDTEQVYRKIDHGQKRIFAITADINGFTSVRYIPVAKNVNKAWVLLEALKQRLECCPRLLTKTRTACTTCPKLSTADLITAAVAPSVPRSALSIGRALPQQRSSATGDQKADERVSVMMTWSVDRVQAEMKQRKTDEETLASLKNNKIDGHSLSMLTHEIVVKYLNLSLGPALKLMSTIEQIRDAYARVKSEVAEPTTATGANNSELCDETAAQTSEPNS